MRKDQYIQHLSREIENLEAVLASKKAARDDYIKFRSGSKKVRLPVSQDEKIGRKALRSSGRARDIFEYLYREGKGVPFSAVSKATGYDVRNIQQFFSRYQPQGLVSSDGDMVFLTATGQQLLEKSGPYASKGRG